MEAATPVEETTEPERPITERLVHYGYVDVGDGATDCDAEKMLRGSCEDPDHFHAFCRLPNGFQKRDILKKAQAAKARTQRRLRDPESDDYETVELEMDELRLAGEAEPIINDLLAKNAVGDVAAAIEEVKNEDPEQWATIDEDSARLDELAALPEERRDDDELEELRRHTTAYWEQVTEEVKRRQDPRRADLESKDLESLIALARNERIEALGTDEFLHAYGLWRMYLCTYDAGNKRTRKFRNVEELQFEADADVVTAIKDFFDLLERGLPKG